MIAHSLHAFAQASMHTRFASGLVRFDKRVECTEIAAREFSGRTHEPYSPVQRGCDGDQKAHLLG